MLCGKPKSLSWTPEAQSFSQLKKAFSTTPILRNPDPQAPFVVEVEASTTRVGAAVSQCNGEPPRPHPCALYSRKLISVEQNYNIGSHELLAIKLALEEWRHWLEGAQLPFTVITDHKHLQYLRETKRLNPRQACWALFFSRFNFSITYRPGGCNMKVDALSRVHSPDSPVEPEPIFPPAMIVSPIQWDISERIRATTRQLQWEAQNGRFVFQHHNVNPFWTQFMIYRVLDAQAASKLSRSSKIGIGGPVIQ